MPLSSNERPISGYAVQALRVVASNPGGGIARHLALIVSVVPVDVFELSESLSLTHKIQLLRAHLAQSRAEAAITHGAAAAVATRHRRRRSR